MPAKNTNRGSAPEAVAAVLATHAGATAAELAAAAGIGQSTAAKALAALEADGAVRRIPGGRGEAGRRQPDRWNATEPAAPAKAVPDGDPRTEAEPEAGRLGRGELAGLVLDFLAARPGEAVGPAAVAKSLGRSAGAVSNALGRLAEAGTIKLVADSPRRYRLPRG